MTAISTLTAVPAPATTPAQVIRQVENDLNSVLIERQPVVRLLLACAVAGQHLCLLGQPGTAKTFLVDQFARRVIDPANTPNVIPMFDVLMSKFTTPEEIFGPVNVAALKNGAYERVIEGSLPQARFAHLDEGWKANSAIMNSLLKLTNERKYKHGTQWLDAPLQALVISSNEMPQEDNLTAIWDRMACRVEVPKLSPAGRRELNFRFTRPGGWPVPVPQAYITVQELEQARVDASFLPVSDQILDSALELIDAVEQKGVRVSERRQGIMWGVVRAHAYIEGRQEVEPEDLQILEHILWNDLGQRVEVSKAIADCIGKFVSEGKNISDSLAEDMQVFLTKLPKLDSKQRSVEAGLMNDKIKIAMKALKALKNTAINEDRSYATLDRYLQEARGFNAQVVAVFNAPA